MTTIESAATTIREPGFEFDEAQLAAVSYLARYGGRTLEAYRHDLRGLFQWAADHGIARGLDRSELGVFLFNAEQYDRDHAASMRSSTTETTPRLPSCSASTGYA